MYKKLFSLILSCLITATATGENTQAEDQLLQRINHVAHFLEAYQPSRDASSYQHLTDNEIAHAIKRLALSKNQVQWLVDHPKVLIYYIVSGKVSIDVRTIEQTISDIQYFKIIALCGQLRAQQAGYTKQESQKLISQNIDVAKKGLIRYRVQTTPAAYKLAMWFFLNKFSTSKTLWGDCANPTWYRENLSRTEKFKIEVL